MHDRVLHSLSFVWVRHSVGVVGANCNFNDFDYTVMTKLLTMSGLVDVHRSCDGTVASADSPALKGWVDLQRLNLMLGGFPQFVRIFCNTESYVSP